MDEDFRQLFEQYATAYDAFSPEGIADFCNEPCLSVRSGIVTSLPNREAVIAFSGPMLEQYKSMGYHKGYIRSVDVSPIGGRGAYAVVGWDIQRADGSSMRVFQTSYNLYKTESGWRILLIINHDA